MGQQQEDIDRLRAIIADLLEGNDNFFLSGVKLNLTFQCWQV